MSDAIRSLDYLMSRFAFNDTGAITDQDAREAIRSAWGWLTTGAPTVDNDLADTAGIGQYFGPGSTWFDLGGQRLYRCISGLAGMANWLQVYPPAGMGSVTSVDTSGSLTGGPITSTGSLSLVNDSDAPGANMAYSTDAVGVKGWNAVATIAAVDAEIASALASWTGSTNLVTLGTISTGVWHGASISTAYTDAKVTSVAGRTGAVVLTSADVGLSAVENTALSTWTGSANLATLGTITAGIWHGTSIGTAYTDAKVTSVAGRAGAVTLTSTDVGLSAVENTALSTWTGSTNIAAVGTIATGTWHGSSIATTYTDAKVISVNGSAGVVVLTKTDIGLANVENTALSTWTGSTALTTLGIITTGVWGGNAIALAKVDITGGTATTYDPLDEIPLYDVSATANKKILAGLLVAAATNPTGTIILYGGSSAPTGYLLCDGSAVSRTTFSTLFAAISTAYGVGNGSTTFNVPDYRGRVPVGSGTGTGLTARSIGGSGGEETHLLTTPEIPSHTHTFPSGAAGASGPGVVPNTALGNQASAATGGGGAHNNMQPWLGAAFYIKT